MDPQEITEELEHPGARNLVASATLLRVYGTTGTNAILITLPAPFAVRS